jgi:hypothetical protein
MESNLENLFLKLYGKHPTNFNWCTQILEALRKQQNGVSERKNRIIMKMTRCMLHEKELPKKL